MKEVFSHGIIQKEGKKAGSTRSRGGAEKLRRHQERADLLYLFKPDLTVTFLGQKKSNFHG